MGINGEMVIGYRSISNTGDEIYAHNPATGERLAPAFSTARMADVETACALAQEAFDAFRQTLPEKRAVFLEAIAAEILDLGDALIERAVAETGLPQGRIEGERQRTIGQLQLFADVVRAGHWVGARLDTALPDRAPAQRADLRMRHIPLGPVAVFGASNFPLAFSVGGGDTASALAAGCPVIFKAHNAHPGTSELVGKAIQRAAHKCDMPEGVFSMIFDGGTHLGAALVANPHIKAVGFTGSRAGGLALMEVAAKRAEPIPVYAEMSSINPVFLLPNRLQENPAERAAEFVASLTLGSGQFCTNPGLVVALEGEALDAFMDAAQKALAQCAAQTMLTQGIHTAYEKGVTALSTHAAVREVAGGAAATGPNQGQAKLYQVSAEAFLADARLADEVFGAASLIVSCGSVDAFIAIAAHLEGQLTATLQLADKDTQLARRLLGVLERKAGRIVCNGYPTGVEVCHAMVHGGPFPATSDGRTTSVGSAAIARFLRPVCYQDVPAALLPVELGDDNPLKLMRLVDGAYADEGK